MARKKDQPPIDGGDNAAAVSGARLRAFMERIERMTEEKAAIGADIRDIFAEAKGNGFSPGIRRILLKRRAADRGALQEQDALVHVYSKALGMESPADAEDNND